MPKETSSKKPRLDSGNCHLQHAKIPSFSHQTPIAKLSDDVLFYIFSMNSRMEMIPFNKESDIIVNWCGEQETLTTNRYSSQVCRRWRNIILSSPTIWANSLDIAELNQPEDEWRLEVMERTGNAPISLIGFIGYVSSREGDNAIPFVLDILNYDWDRIRYLCIWTNDPYVEKQMRRSLQEPAPRLEYLLYMTGFMEDEEPQSLRLQDGAVLFSNMSPKLTSICCEGIAFDFVPGLSNLRKLWLTGYQASFTIPELYVGLQHLPMLEDLFIDCDDLLESAGLGDHIPSISLPRLADIAISHLMRGFTLIIELLRHIVPAPGCQLVLPRVSLSEANDKDLAILRQFYSTFIENITDFRPAPYISLSYTQDADFAFRAANGPLSFSRFDPRSTSACLNFAFSCRSQEGSSILHTFSLPIMKVLASRTDVAHITKLDLKLETLDCPRAEIYEFLRKLQSVSELTTNLPTIRLLPDIQATSELPLLPSTTTIIITPSSYSSRKIDSPRDYLNGFLKGRMGQGIPVLSLKLPEDDYNDDGRWDFLDQVDGLSVLWRRWNHYGIVNDDKSDDFLAE